MPEPETVRLAAPVLEAIREAAREAYPHEGCGALLGRADGLISESVPIPNREQDRPRVRFAVSPQDYMEVEDAADARGLVLRGFWHSHPDHPARPSETDRRYAWEGLLTLVIAVASGEPKELTAWGVASQEAPFHELRLEVAPAAPESVAAGDAREENEHR